MLVLGTLGREIHLMMPAHKWRIALPYKLYLCGVWYSSVNMSRLDWVWNTAAWYSLIIHLHPSGALMHTLMGVMLHVNMLHYGSPSSALKNGPDPFLWCIAHHTVHWCTMRWTATQVLFFCALWVSFILVKKKDQVWAVLMQYVNMQHNASC